jgi:hypothetical protein
MEERIADSYTQGRNKGMGERAGSRYPFRLGATAEWRIQSHEAPSMYVLEKQAKYFVL